MGSTVEEVGVGAAAVLEIVAVVTLQEARDFLVSHCTVVWINQESRCKYWVTHSSVCSFAQLTHSLASDCLLRSLPALRSLVRLLAHLAHSLARGKVIFWCLKMTRFCPIVHWPALIRDQVGISGWDSWKWDRNSIYIVDQMARFFKLTSYSEVVRKCSEIELPRRNILSRLEDTRKVLT